MSCIFCDVIAGRQPRTLVYEDDTAIVIKDIHPQASTHVLVIPKKHASDLMELSSEELQHLMEVGRTLIRKHGIKNYRIVNNGGGAQIIDHVHFHIMGSVDTHRDL